MRIKTMASWALFIFWIFTAEALSFESPLPNAAPNVVLVTLDGIRWNEIFEGSDSELTGTPSETVMPHLTQDLAREGMLLGDTKTSSVFVANSVNMSLPGYQSIFAGFPTRCYTNFCRTTRVRTFPEELVSRYHFDHRQMAAFASWSQIARAYSRPGAPVYLNAGLKPSGLEDPFHAYLDRIQMEDIPKWNRPGIWTARYDRFTYAHALHHLKTEHPRFLYLSLLDADEEAHAGHYQAYLDSLKTYDRWIREIADTLDSMGEYGRNTLLIVTTDHGRGKGGNRWMNHGMRYPESHRIFMYLRGRGIDPGTHPIPGTVLTHNAIKTIVEKTMSSASFRF
jgi:hypothetical protein